MAVCGKRDWNSRAAHSMRERRRTRLQARARRHVAADVPAAELRGAVLDTAPPHKNFDPEPRQVSLVSIRECAPRIANFQEANSPQFGQFST
jgi:hypothetical protein